MENSHLPNTVVQAALDHELQALEAAKHAWARTSVAEYTDQQVWSKELRIYF